MSNYKVTGTKNFDDLVADRILFLDKNEAIYVLKSMFPDEEINIFIDRGGNTQVTVGEVKLSIQS